MNEFVKYYEHDLDLKCIVTYIKVENAKLKKSIKKIKRRDLALTMLFAGVIFKAYKDEKKQNLEMKKSQNEINFLKSEIEELQKNCKNEVNL